LFVLLERVLSLMEVMTNASHLRQQLRPMRVKSTGLALAIFALDAVLYVAAVIGALTASGFWIALACGAIAGVATGMLFVVGHDACHGSLTSSPQLNAWIGRSAFLPSLTPFRAWDEGHNRTHHVYTNLKGRDYIWTPFSLDEFRALPRWRQILERCYRSPLGVGLYYGVEVWGKHLMFSRDVDAVWDSLLCSGFAGVLSVVAWLAAGWQGWFAGVAWPFLVWNWMMGWAIFEHHTHPAVPWFDDEHEWRAAGAQTLCTVHIVLPGVVDFVLHRIMQHTAHHLDVTVPLYRLTDAQSAVERSAEVVTYRWSPLTFLRHLRACQIYDYDESQWLHFDGAPSSPPVRVSRLEQLVR
jgi:omega-6 fatty acid desaturase (delta-12 desaturase)